MPSGVRHQLLAPGRSPELLGCGWSRQCICGDTNQARSLALCDTDPHTLQQPAELRGRQRQPEKPRGGRGRQDAVS